MAVRFGTVPDELAGRVEAGSEAELGRWALRVLTATTLSDVIKDNVGPTAWRKPAARKPATRTRTGQAVTTSKRRTCLAAARLASNPNAAQGRRAAQPPPQSS